MTYPTNFEQKIGFDKIRQLLSDKCISSLGKMLVEEMCFSTSYDNIIAQLEESNEFIKIIEGEKEFPANYFFDVRPALKRIRIEGTFLDESELFDLRRSLETIHAIVRFFDTPIGDTPLYPRLAEKASSVDVFPQLITSIDGILDKFGHIKENATPELQRIKRDMASTISSISRSLNAILRSAQSEGFVEKDVAPTMRDGRLVIPVAPTFKRRIKGIVHDESASGKTVFIEPAQVVEANNRVRELENEERREIMRILLTMSDKLRPSAPQIIESYLFLSLIDLVRAKALFAIQTNSVLPHVHPDPHIDWVHAIHPLLFLSLLKQQKTVVPLDITLTPEQRILLISGPNAGGKSVCLKTVGLLQYMLQCGLLIPLYDNSHIGIFDHIFIDIGDEQSIENDLSTYSSHLTNMKHFVRHCNSKTLLLIDEFGSGTEPQIGGAIAQALLQRFNQRNAFGVITTHYQNLKHLAEDTAGLVNGAMMYDRHLMQPLFKLSIGNPGSSFAVEIARKIGLPEEVITDASDLVGSEYINMDKYLQDIVRDKRYWESKRQSIRQQEKRLEETSARYIEDLSALEKERKGFIASARKEAEAVLKEANAKIENTIRLIKESQADKEKTKEARRELEEFKKRLSQIEEKTNDDHITRKIEKLKARDERKKEVKPIIKTTAPVTSTKETQKEIPITVNDTVRIKDQGTVAQVVAIQGRNITVAIGMIKQIVKLEQVERISRNQLKKENSSKNASFISVSTTDDMRNKSLNFRQEIDVRGMRGDEALQAVTYYIDDAILVGVSSVRILHGTGTGALRQIIRQYLGTIRDVASFRDEHIQLGGAGVTVVEFV